MSKPSNATHPTERVWRFFVSIKVTIVLLVLWGLGSVAGTLIPQNAEAWRYVQAYGPETANWLSKLGFFDVYHSTWYSLILLLLILAIVACSLNTLSAKIALAVTQPKTRRVSGTSKHHITRDIPCDDPPTALQALKREMEKDYKNVHVDDSPQEVRLYAHKQAFAHFMVYAVHLGLVIIVLGGVISALFGFEGVMEIPEGESRDVVFKRNESGHAPAALPFALRLDRFELQRFDTGAPKDYVSELTVLDGGQAVKSKRIEVNTPLNVGDYNFYQSSYIEQAALLVTERATGRTAQAVLQPFERRFLADLDLWVRLDTFRVDSQGMSAAVTLARPDGSVQQVTLLPDLEKNRVLQADQPLTVAFAKDRPAYTTGLMVVRDPGALWIWVGSFLMVLGLYLTFYTSHRRLAVQSGGAGVILRGWCQRNPQAFSREIDALIRRAGLPTGDHGAKDSNA